MRGRPCNLQGEGVFEISSLESGLEKWEKEVKEPKSVLDPRRSSSSSPTPSTSSSSFGGCSDYSVGVASVQKPWEWPHTQQQQEEHSAGVADQGGGYGGKDWSSCSLELHPIPSGLDVVNGGEKCGLGVEDWETMLSDSGGAVLGQEQSVLGWIMGEVEDPSSGLKKSGGGIDYQNSSGFGIVDPDLGFGGGGGVRGGVSAATAAMNFGDMNSSLAVHSSGFPSNFSNGKMNSSFTSNGKVPFFGSNNSTSSPNPIVPVSLPHNVFYQQNQFQGSELKHQAFNSASNQGFLVPLSYDQQVQHLVLSPQQSFPHQQQFLPQSLPNRPTMATKPKVGEEVLHRQQQQEDFVDQLFKAAELVEAGNLVHARGILARLNHQLSHAGKPCERAAFLFMEAMQLLLLTNNNESISPHRSSTPIDVVMKINAYKAFSEVSPLLQFTNFTCNQALLEALESYSNIHIVDFNIEFGGQWASFMQEIRMRIGGIASLKITAIVSTSSHDQLELNLTRENLSHFASELGIPFELNLVSIDSFNPASWSLAVNVSEIEAVAVNLPAGGPPSHLSSLPWLLRLVKQLSPKIVVSVDRGSNRSDLPFSHFFLHSLQSCVVLIDSLDAVNVNPEIVRKIEKFFLLPTIEKTILGCQQPLTKMPPWKSLFTSAGFSAVTFSNFTETQAEYVLKRLPARGFHVEKRHVSLMLCWQRQELASVSAWRC